MRRKLSKVAKKKARPRAKLGLPDLDQAKAAVLGSLRSPESQRGYRHAMDEFILWYCSEPRLSFNKTVVTRYRIHLEGRQLAPGTIDLRLAVVRRLAYEAADSGLLSPELAAGIRRVKGARNLGVRLGNWLTAEQARTLWQVPGIGSLKAKRDRAVLSILLGCGLRRHELAELTYDHLQQQDGHWAVVDLVGKGGHVRTVPVPDWVKGILDDWLIAARVGSGRLFRCVSKVGTAWGEGITEKVVWRRRPKAVGLGVSVFVQVRLEKQVEASLNTFEKAVAARPEVMECYLMTGSSDYLLRVVVSDLQEFQRFVTDVSKIPGVGNIQSSVALKPVKYKTALPLPIEGPQRRRRHSRR